MSEKLRIGIPITLNDGKYTLNEEYINLIKNCEFRPVPVMQKMKYNLEKLNLNGLLLTGGYDIDPTYYGEINTASFPINRERDDFERKLLLSTLDIGLPVFGICRGLQIMARQLIQTYPKQCKDILRFSQHINYHAYWATPKKLLGFLFKNLPVNEHQAYKLNGDKVEIVNVSSFHHQAVLCKTDQENIPINPLHGKLVYTYWSDYKTPKSTVVIEGFEIPTIKWYGYQPHPEREGKNGIKLVKEFFEKYAGE